MINSNGLIFGQNYYGGQYSNFTGSVGFQTRNFRFIHENDMFGLPNTSDKFRTAATRVSVKMGRGTWVHLGQELFTNEYVAGKDNATNYDDLLQNNSNPFKFFNSFLVKNDGEVYLDNDNTFRNGLVYASLSHRGQEYRLGSNSMAGGHYVQNPIHTAWGIPHFNWLGQYPTQWYFQHSDYSQWRLYH